jgi:hypothetical protein
MSTSAKRALSNRAGETCLHGQIDAIGIFDLLRVAMRQQSTGRLSLSNEERCAELIYEQGRLVEASCHHERGVAALGSIFAMAKGEFEYVRGRFPRTGSSEPVLHDALVEALRRHSRTRVSVRCDAADGQPRPYVSGVHQVANPVDVDAGWTEPEEEPSVPSSTSEDSDRSVLAYRAGAIVNGALASGELGRATLDGAGHLNEQYGQITTHETHCAASLVQLSADFATVLELGALRRLEVNSPEKSVLCRKVNDVLLVSVIDSSAARGAVWRGLES